MFGQDRARVLGFISFLYIVCVMPSFAEEAPVYDADDYSQDITDNQGSADSALPARLPPMPSQNSSASSYNNNDVTSTTFDAPLPRSLTQGQRIDRLEQQIDNLEHTNINTRVNHFQNEIQALRGKIDALQHKIDLMQRQQQTMYTDLDRRILGSVDKTAIKNNLTAAHAKVKVATPKKPASKTKKSYHAKKSSQPNVAEEQQTYQLAYDLIKAEKYDQAVAALQGMLVKYPTGQFAANAHYWLGELYSLQGKNIDAARSFRSVLKKYPSSPRTSDAGLKLGLIYAAQMKWSEAKATLNNVINRYPGSASARLAAEQLKQIKQSGH